MNAPTDTIRNENQSADSSRNAKGQFAPGNKGGPGNPFGDRVANFRKAVLACITPEDIHEIVKGLIDMAKMGHFNAAKLVLMYFAGKPDQTPPSEAWDFYREVATRMQPSPNGDFVDESPSPNGEMEAPPPSPNGDFVNRSPSTNGVLRVPAPSENGVLQPALNRKERRALRKKERLAKNKRNTPTPVTAPSSNGISTSS